MDTYGLFCCMVGLMEHSLILPGRIDSATKTVHTNSVPYLELFCSWCTGLGSQTQTPQTLKSVQINLIKNRQTTVHEQRERCFELVRMLNSQYFLGLYPWTPLRRAYSAPSQTPQLHNSFSACYVRRKTGTPQKNWHCSYIS